MTWQIVNADCVEAMAAMDENSVDAIVTDPPYGLGFMGKAWDDLPPGDEFGAAALRVLKPGGHLLAFGGTRTYHRLACALEDAGFEIRDCLAWLYGSGFPKSLDVSKAIDKAAGAEREVYAVQERNPKPRDGSKIAQADLAERFVYSHPATPDAERWQGWGTALKPAFEPIVLARKPLSERNVAANVLRWGTGALNVDGCRIEGPKASGSGVPGWFTSDTREGEFDQASGRWPANVTLDETAAAQMGPNSRYFYQPKADRAERENGIAQYGDAPRRFAPTMGDGIGGREHSPEDDRAYARNHHPTVKPVELMAWLCRMVTPPKGLVLDPFAGSGSTLIAALREGFDAVGIERDAEYVEIARARVQGDAPLFNVGSEVMP